MAIAHYRRYNYNNGIEKLANEDLADFMIRSDDEKGALEELGIRVKKQGMILAELIHLLLKKGAITFDEVKGILNQHGICDDADKLLAINDDWNWKPEGDVR